MVQFTQYRFTSLFYSRA